MAGEGHFHPEELSALFVMPLGNARVNETNSVTGDVLFNWFKKVSEEESTALCKELNFNQFTQRVKQYENKTFLWGGPDKRLYDMLKAFMVTYPDSLNYTGPPVKIDRADGEEQRPANERRIVFLFEQHKRNTSDTNLAGVRAMEFGGYTWEDLFQLYKRQKRGEVTRLLGNHTVRPVRDHLNNLHAEEMTGKTRLRKISVWGLTMIYRMLKARQDLPKASSSRSRTSPAPAA